MATFGDRLRQLLNESEIQYKDFAKLLKVSPSAISNWMSGERFPNDEKILLFLADYFGVTLDYLLGRVDFKNGFTAEHTIDGHKISVIAEKESFPNGFTKEDAAEAYEVAKAIEALGLTNEELNILLSCRELGIELKDLALITKLKEIGINFNPKDE
jgi:Helix-turn-helix.